MIYETLTGVHVSGHARQEGLKLMLNLVRPEFFLPVHGEYRHLVQHARLAQEVGVPSENIFIAEIGDVLEVAPGSAAITGKVRRAGLRRRPGRWGCGQYCPARPETVGPGRGS